MEAAFKMVARLVVTLALCANGLRMGFIPMWLGTR
jgi:hypothetical protein